MKKVLVIVGPTAIGKTSFSIEMAKKYHGEVISGDSIQVYRGFDIGSGKVLESEMDGIKHHLIDILSPLDNYNVKDFQTKARKCIDEISSTGHLPIICGGTGLYIKACLYDYLFNDEEEKDDEFLNLSNEEIYQRLKELDPKALDKIHINNRKRLVRALNICLKNDKKMSDIVDSQKHEMIYDALIIGLDADREVVYDRINKRVDKMFKEGLKEEVDKLLENGLSFDNQAMQGIGYRQFREYYEGKLDLDEVKALIQRDSRRYAKRQYTWFKNQMDVKFINIEHLNEAELLIKEWLDE